jgi:ketosteroid isomerase-like protein
MVNGDAGPLAEVPKRNGHHHASDRRSGGCWDAVRGSFDKVAQISSNGEVVLKDQLIRVSGDLAYEIGVERGQLKLGGHRATIDHRVTNVYQRIDGAWKIVHHHRDTSPAMLDVLGRLQSSSGKAGG